MRLIRFSMFLYFTTKVCFYLLFNLLPPQTIIGTHHAIIRNGVWFDDDFVGILQRSLGPHTDRPSRARCLDNRVIGLSGTLAVHVKYLSDRIGSLQYFDLGFGGTLSGVSGPPHDLDG